ncbi:MAG: 3'-5' exonuclease [Saprospiraceae bacterium]|nr:3'-5' exonuclease [Saprospiraceae bacterium]
MNNNKIFQYAFLFLQKKLIMNLSNILFIDIETVSENKVFDELPSEMQEFWKNKSKYWIKEEGVSETDVSEIYKNKAGIYAEFAKVICISIGFIYTKNDKNEIRIKSFYGDDEKKLLSEFAELLNNKFDKPEKFRICGHNIKEFDIPFLSRRMVINEIKLPELLNIAGKKPWEVQHITDTMEMWKFGDYKNYTSLALLATILGIKSPKDDIDGSMVGQVYWETGDLERIVRYCEKDVKTVAQIFLRMNYLPLLEE